VVRRSVVFSFDVVLYEMLTGRQPFRGDTAAEIMASVTAGTCSCNRFPRPEPDTS
jgi:hypothetical protein